MKKIFAGVLSVILFAVLIIGCSSNTSSSSSGKSSGDQVTIKMSVSGSEQEKQLRYETADLFMKSNPNIKIEWVDLGNDRYQKTLTLVSGGETPDILYLNDWVAPLSQKKVLQPLDDFINSDPSFKLDDFYKPLIDGYKYENKIYALAQEVSPIVVYYNKDLFDKAGVPYPKADWTQDDLIATAKKLTNSSKKQYGFLMETWLAGGFLNRNGAHMYTSDGKKSGFNTPEALQALQIMRKVIDDKSSPNSAEQKAQGQGRSAQFRNQQVAMMSSGMWELPSFKAEPLTFKWDVVRMPKGVNQITKAGVMEWGISAQTKHSKEAWEVLKFFVGHEGMKIVAKYNMALPATNDKEANQMILDSKFPESVKVFVDSAPDVNLEEVNNVKSAEINSSIGEQVDLMLLGKQSPEITQKNIDEKMNKILSE